MKFIFTKFFCRKISVSKMKMKADDNKPMVFHAKPLFHERNKLKTLTLKFKTNPFNKIKTDFLRAVNALLSIQDGGDCDFLVIPHFPPMNFNKKFHAQHGRIILVVAKDFV